MPSVKKSTTPIEERDEWRTDPVLFHVLDHEFHFNLDAAATRENTLCKSFFSMTNSALDNQWDQGWPDFSGKTGTRVWCNPPFSLKAQFLQKGWEEFVKRDVKSCFLLPGDAEETDWWRNAVYDLEHPIGPNLYQAKTHARILKPRVNFFSPDMTQNKGNNRPSALIFYGWDLPHGKFHWDWRKTAIEAGLLVKKGRIWVLRDDLIASKG